MFVVDVCYAPDTWHWESDYIIPRNNDSLACALMAAVGQLRALPAMGRDVRAVAVMDRTPTAKNPYKPIVVFERDDTEADVAFRINLALRKYNAIQA